MNASSTGEVTVVVITYNDAEHVTTAVESALGQGKVVGEVIVVDDCSADATADVLAPLEAADSRVRVLARTVNSGGCGTPRNDGIAAAGGRYLMFLDSDDVLPPGAVQALLTQAHHHAADVTAGRAVRRELPGGQDTTWAPQLYDTAAGATLPGTVLNGVKGHPEILRDTLSVNKLYLTAFLRSHSLTFPDGAFHYEDFVFTARLYAARPRLAVTDALVYVWHVRRKAGRLSISLRRDDIANWRQRVTAHRGVVDTFRDAGEYGLAEAAQAKFLDYDLPMYLRELPQHPQAYVSEWWRITRDYLNTFDQEGVALAPAPARWTAAELAAHDSPDPALVRRLVELSARPARLIPPYEGTEPPGLAGLPADALPVAVDGRVQGGASIRIGLRVHDLYGKVGALHPVAVRLEITERGTATPAVAMETPLVSEGDSWTAAVRLHATDLTRGGRLAIWHLRAELRYAGTPLRTRAVIRAADGQEPRRGAVVSGTGRVVLVQTHVAADRALIIRVADGVEGVRRVIRGRIGRLMHRG